MLDDAADVAAVRERADRGRRAGRGAPRRLPRARPLEQRGGDSLLIAVTGATGAVGGRVAAQLAERGAAQRLVVRDPARAPRIEGADVVGGASYDDGEAMRRAFDGRRDRLPRLRRARTATASACTAARSTPPSRRASSGSSTRRSSAPPPTATFTFGRDHFHTEQLIKATRRSRWTFLRDNIYLDFVPFFAGEDGVIRGPAGDGRVAAVARDDFAAVAAAVLTDDGPRRPRPTTMTGPEALTLGEAAERCRAAAGRPVTYVRRDARGGACVARARAAPPTGRSRAGSRRTPPSPRASSSAVSGDVERLTGRPPISLAEFLRDNPDSYRHLRPA